MNTNKLCRTVLDIKEVMEVQLKSKLLLKSLSKEEKEGLATDIEEITGKYVDIMIDNILKEASE